MRKTLCLFAILCICLSCKNDMSSSSLVETTHHYLEVVNNTSYDLVVRINNYWLQSTFGELYLPPRSTRDMYINNYVDKPVLVETLLGSVEEDSNGEYTIYYDKTKYRKWENKVFYSTKQYTMFVYEDNASITSY